MQIKLKIKIPMRQALKNN